MCRYKKTHMEQLSKDNITLNHIMSVYIMVLSAVMLHSF